MFPLLRRNEQFELVVHQELVRNLMKNAIAMENYKRNLFVPEAHRFFFLKSVLNLIYQSKFHNNTELC